MNKLMVLFSGKHEPKLEIESGIIEKIIHALLIKTF